jgi:glycosyltransferase involved in cell wall biosynthesis
MSMDILGVTPLDWLGVRRALLGMTPHVFDPREAPAVIETHRPRVVVLGCYGPWAHYPMKVAERVGARVAFTWFASYVLNDFDRRNREWMTAALRLVQTGRITYVATPHTGLNATWRHAGIRTSWFPCVVTDELTLAPPVTGPPAIGLFGSGQPWKNMDTQLMAASLVEGATIHVSTKPAESVAPFFDVPLVVHPRMTSDEAYRSVLGQMSVNLCVSMSETFSYLVAESLLLGTPVVTSSLVPMLQVLKMPPVLHACCVDQFDNPVKIAERIRLVLEYREVLRTVGREHMLRINRTHRKAMERLKTQWLNG